MVKEQAVVLRSEANRVAVELLRSGACEACELTPGCGTGALGRLLGHRRKPVVLETTLDLRPGDRIVLGLPDAGFLGASLLIYGLPLLGAILAALVVKVVYALPEAMVALAALAGLGSGLAVSGGVARSGVASRIEPRILAVNGELVGEKAVLVANRST